MSDEGVDSFYSVISSTHLIQKPGDPIFWVLTHEIHFNITLGGVKNTIIIKKIQEKLLFRIYIFLIRSFGFVLAGERIRRRDGTSIHYHLYLRANCTFALQTHVTYLRMRYILILHSGGVKKCKKNYYSGFIFFTLYRRNKKQKVILFYSFFDCPIRVESTTFLDFLLFLLASSDISYYHAVTTQGLD